MLFTIIISAFLSRSLKAAKLCFPKKIRLKKFAFSIYQQFPKMMSMDLYIRQVSKTAHGDCKSQIKLPRNISIFPDRDRQFRVEPPVHDHPTACPTSATCARGYWLPAGESNCRRSFSRRARRAHLLFGENIRQGDTYSFLRLQYIHVVKYRDNRPLYRVFAKKRYFMSVT